MALSSWSQMLADAGDAAKDFEPVPEGTYLVKIVKADDVKTQGGKDMFKVTCEVVDGPFAKNKIFNNYVVSPESAPAMGFFFRNMSAIGIPTTFFDTNPTNRAVAQALMGKTFIATVGIREYNGKESNEITGHAKDPAAASGGGVPSVPGMAAPSGPPSAPVSAPTGPPPAPVTAPSAPVETPPAPVEAPAEAVATAPVDAPSTDAPADPF